MKTDCSSTLFAVEKILVSGGMIGNSISQKHNLLVGQLSVILYIVSNANSDAF